MMASHENKEYMVLGVTIRCNANFSKKKTDFSFFRCQTYFSSVILTLSIYIFLFV